MLRRPAPGIRIPGSWEPKAAVWTTWPYRADIWGDRLAGAQEAVARTCIALAHDGNMSGAYTPERVHLIVNDAATAAEFRNKYPREGAHIRTTVTSYWDGWLNDTGPVFTKTDAGILQATTFAFNGWGRVFDDTDGGLADFVAGLILPDARVRKRHYVFEGGSIESDGVGGVIATKQSLLNPNRGHARTPRTAEFVLRDALGVTYVNWLERGLPSDRKGGQVCRVARHVAPTTMLCMEPRRGADPNAEVCKEILAAAKKFRNGAGARIDIATIPSPGLVTDYGGTPMPASYLDFLIGNTAVIVPVFGVAADDEACARISAAIPSRHVVAVDFRAMLEFGGGPHSYMLAQPIGA